MAVEADGELAPDEPIRSGADGIGACSVARAKAGGEESVALNGAADGFLRRRWPIDHEKTEEHRYQSRQPHHTPHYSPLRDLRIPLSSWMNCAILAPNWFPQVSMDEHDENC